MTSEEIEAIRAACANATEGPWKAVYEHDERQWAYHLASVDSQDVTYYIHDAAQTYQKRDSHVGSNAEFIAGARAWVPALLDEVEGLRAALADIRNDSTSSDLWLRQKAQDALAVPVKGDAE